MSEAGESNQAEINDQKDPSQNAVVVVKRDDVGHGAERDEVKQVGKIGFRLLAEMSATAQLGAGNDKAGGIMNTTGSSEMVSILVDKAVIDPENYHYYLRNAAVPGLWQIYVTTCGGFGITWFRKEFCREMSEEEFYRYEAEEIRKYISAGNNNGITFDPYLTGDRQDLPKKTAGWHGIDLNANPTRGQMLVALLSSIQDVMISAITKAGEVCALDPVVKLAGGMSKSEPYREMKMNAYRPYGIRELKYVENCETLGCVRLAQRYL